MIFETDAFFEADLQNACGTVKTYFINSIRTIFYCKTYFSQRLKIGKFPIKLEKMEHTHLKQELI